MLPWQVLLPCMLWQMLFPYTVAGVIAIFLWLMAVVIAMFTVADVIAICCGRCYCHML